MPDNLYLAEQHIVRANDPRWAALNTACFKSKNLYNAANYRLRKEYIFKGRYIPYEELVTEFKQNRLLDDQRLPAKVVQQVLKQLNQDWQSFFAARKEYEAHPEKFNGRPRLPGYK